MSLSPLQPRFGGYYELDVEPLPPVRPGDDAPDKQAQLKDVYQKLTQTEAGHTAMSWLMEHLNLQGVFPRLMGDRIVLIADDTGPDGRPRNDGNESSRRFIEDFRPMVLQLHGFPPDFKGAFPDTPEGRETEQALKDTFDDYIEGQIRTQGSTRIAVGVNLQNEENPFEGFFL